MFCFSKPMDNNAYIQLKQKIDLVAFDMDLTVLDIHTRGAVSVKPLSGSEHGYSLDSAATHIVDTFKEIVPQLLNAGIKVGIATNSDSYMKGSQRDENGNYRFTSGEPLVKEILKRAFPGKDEITSQIYICAWMGRESNYIGKNNHIARLWEKIIGKETNQEILDEESFLPYHDSGEDYWPNMKIDAPKDESYYFSRTMLVDDDENNLYLAESKGVKICHVMKRRGLTKKDWNDGVNVALKS